MAQIAQERLVVLNRPVAAPYYKSLFDGNMQRGPVVSYATSTEMVRSLVASGHGVAILNMRPLSSETYCGAPVEALPIADALPPLTLVVGYDKKRPRRIVQEFANACRDHFAGPKSAQYVCSIKIRH